MSQLVPREIKLKIIEMCDTKMTTGAILYRLQKDYEKAPTKSEVTYIIRAHNERKYEKSKISLGEIFEWFENNSEIPIDLAKPFVAAYKYSKAEVDEMFVRFFVTT